MKSDIVLDAQLDPGLFSLSPVEGFKVVEAPQAPRLPIPKRKPTKTNK